MISQIIPNAFEAKKVYNRSMFKSRKNRLYFDYSSRTPIRKEALKDFVQKERYFGNSSSIHQNGIEARNIIKEAKDIMAKNIGGNSDEILFVSSATLGSNIFLRGVVLAAKKGGIQNPHVIVSMIEHDSVRGIFDSFEKEGVEVSRVSCDEYGYINEEEFKNTLKENTVLVSFTYVSNEIGTVQNIKEISKIIRNFKKETLKRKEGGKLSETLDRNFHYPAFFVDACQASCYMDLDTKTLGVDGMILNSSKCYGPTGASMLFVKNSTPITPIVWGGKDEEDLYPGTISPSLVHAFAVAIDETRKNMTRDIEKISKLRDRFEKEIQTKSSDRIEILGKKDGFSRSPSISGIFIKGIQSELMVIEMDERGISISSGSACRSSEEEIARIVPAIGKDPKHDDGFVRISFGRENTDKDVDVLVENFLDILDKYEIS